MTDDEGRPLYPLLIFDWIDWQGPLEKPDDVRSAAGLFPADNASAEEVLAGLMRFARRLVPARHRGRNPPLCGDRLARAGGAVLLSRCLQDGARGPAGLEEFCVHR